MINSLTNKKPRKLYVTEIEVTGRGRFPFDMLRYDNCVVVEGCNEIDKREERTIRLLRYGPELREATDGRWQSFGWIVTRDSAKTCF